MANLTISILKHQKRKDDTYPILIRLTHNRKSVYIPTGISLKASFISKDLTRIKDKGIEAAIERTIDQYNRIIVDQIGLKIHSFSASDLKDYLLKSSKNSDGIDFVAFSRSHIDYVRQQNGRKNYAGSLESSLNMLIDYFRRDKVYITEITHKELVGFLNYLQRPHEVIRHDNRGNLTKRIYPGVREQTAIDYVKNLRTLFNAARNEFNDEDGDEMVITHYPFRKFKLETARATSPVKRSITIKHIRSIRDASVSDNRFETRLSIGRDIFMLSFYMAGMNVVDLYNAEPMEDGRVSYNRTKTKNRRKDKAFISIKVEPEALPIIEKYRDESGKHLLCFHRRYGDSQNFLRAVNTGLSLIAEKTGTKRVTSYSARHSWATIARNKCGVSRDDISVALNHVDDSSKVTDMYIAKDWGIIDRANRKVLDLLLQSDIENSDQ